LQRHAEHHPEAPDAQIKTAPYIEGAGIYFGSGGRI
jgi:hypothetical protein